MDKCAVRYRDFAVFVEATQYRTESEQIGWSFVFAGDLPTEVEAPQVLGAEWWRAIEGATW